MRRRDRDGVPDDEEKRQIHGRRLTPEPCERWLLAFGYQGRMLSFAQCPELRRNVSCEAVILTN